MLCQTRIAEGCVHVRAGSSAAFPQAAADDEADTEAAAARAALPDEDDDFSEEVEALPYILFTCQPEFIRNVDWLACFGMLHLT